MTVPGRRTRSKGGGTPVLWALDLETGGLSRKTDQILAVGMVPIRGETVRLEEGYATLVRPPETRPSSSGALAAHQILPGETRSAPRLSEVLPEVDRRLREGILLAHHARLDMSFLKRGYLAVGLPWPRPRVIDTVDLLRKLAAQERFLGQPDREPLHNLAEARRELGLPAYPGHDALTDAVATAELYLALRARLGLAL